MTQTPTEIIEDAYEKAKENSIEYYLSALPNECVQELQIIIDNAEKQKGVLGVTLTSILYKVLEPTQDIRLHQRKMKGGYSGRSFDTKYVTPFLKRRFSHFAMAESAWLTRSLEQPHPYNFDYPGKIQNPKLKTAFLSLLNRIEADPLLAPKLLIALTALLLNKSSDDDMLSTSVHIKSGISILKIIEGVNKHFHYKYKTASVGTARLPVLAIYSVYNLLIPEVKRYEGKILAPLESHTSPDYRSHSFGDIDVLNADLSSFESIEIKHNKPISADMVSDVYRKIKNTYTERYYILTTREPNFTDYDSVIKEIEKYKSIHPCQIIVNGVTPSLKYYLRLINKPQDFINEYSKWLHFEYQRGSGIKKEHITIWHEICRTELNLE